MSLIEDVFKMKEVNLLEKYVPYRDVLIANDLFPYFDDEPPDEEDVKKGYTRYYLMYSPSNATNHSWDSWGKYVSAIFVEDNSSYPEIKAIKDFILSCKFENLPLYINHIFLAPFAKWRLELSR